MPQIENGAVVNEFWYIEKCLAIVAHRADESQEGNHLGRGRLPIQGLVRRSGVILFRTNGLALNPDIRKRLNPHPTWAER